MGLPHPTCNHDLKDFLKQNIYVDDRNIIIIESNPQSFQDKYHLNMKYLRKNKIYTIDQLAKNTVAQRMIMSEVNVEQFQLAYDYRNRQLLQPFSYLPYSNSGYTFRLGFANRLSNGRNVLVIGGRGSGKSSLINALGNSLIIDYADRFRYHIAEYDYTQYIQECDLDVQDVRFKFLEVFGYGQNLEQNHNIMLQIYEHLQKHNIQIDCIIICKRFGTQYLSKQEKQIIYHLAEVFGQQFIKRCFLVNTNYDLGMNNQIQNLLQQDLNRINDIYNQMPKPKILFVNSSTIPFQGKEGDRRFQTVKDIRDAITNLITNDTQRISSINQDAFIFRRQEENEMRLIKNQIKNSLVELLPCLENYFSICEINEKNDPEFYVKTISWTTLEKDKRKKNDKQLSVILDDIILPDSIIAMIQEVTYLEQFKFLRDQLTDEKTRRLKNIHQLVDKYITKKQDYLKETYIHIEETKEELITKNMNQELKLYIQQEQDLQIEELRKEFEDIRQQLYLPNVNLLATQIIQ